MGTRVSFGRQDIKRDKFADFMGEAREWATNNAATLFGGVAIIVLLTVGLYFYQDYQAGIESEARTELAAARARILSGNLQVGLLELRGVADKYSGSATGAEALYMLGSANYLSKNNDQAKAAFEEYVSKYSKLKVTHGAALAGIAACLENTGDNAGAADQFIKALDYYPDSPIAEDNALGALRNYLLAGDTANARKVLDRITSDYWQSQAPSIAQRIFEEIKPAN
jgi:TolA-binding protein